MLVGRHDPLDMVSFMCYLFTTQFINRCPGSHSANRWVINFCNKVTRLNTRGGGGCAVVGDIILITPFSPPLLYLLRSFLRHFLGGLHRSGLNVECGQSVKSPLWRFQKFGVTHFLNITRSDLFEYLSEGAQLLQGSSP